MKSKVIYIIITLAILAIPMRAQNTNSPYTRFGYGELEDGCFSKSLSMGGSAMGLRSKNTINPLNPASYSSLDSTTFIFEMGVSALWSNFKGIDKYKNSFTGNLDYVALQLPVTRWLGLSAGLIPYSYVGYSFNTTDSLTIPGEETYNVYTQSFSGKGGISQVYLGLSFDIAKHFSIGANVYYMFGNITQYRAIDYTSAALISHNTIAQNVLHISSFNCRFGVQYHDVIGRNSFCIGAIYEFRTKLGGELEKTATGVDTTSVNSKELFELPSLYGGGISYTYDNRITLAADFTFMEYSKANYFGSRDSLANRIKVALGGEYMHKPNGFKYVDRVAWRVGANVRQSYIKTNSKQSLDFSITCGVGLPLKTSRTLININLEYGNIGTQNGAALKEQYLKLGLNFALNEIWFVKSKIR